MIARQRAFRIAAGLALALGVTALAQHTILLEAEAFAEKGGWQVDQQFTHIVGSSYLLAHGLGRPVADATTGFEVPVAGTYRLWVRTRDWVPGPWEPPGRFRVVVNGTVVETVFGTEPGWAWQDGGALQLAEGTNRVALHDLTGFDGRCDAVLLCSDLEYTPPDEPGALRRWRNRLRGLPETPPLAGQYDVVVVGGGIAGCAAVLAASSQGLRVALIHDRPVLGGNASGEIRVHTEGIHGRGAGILERLDTEHWPNGSAKALADDRRRHAAMEAADNTSLFLKWRAYGVSMDGDRITAVNARHIESGEVLRVEAPVFIDSTGDGWVGFWAGADLRYGRESYDEHGERWEKWGDLWSPSTPDRRVMGSSLLWYSQAAEEPVRFPDVPWAMPVAGDHAATKGEWYWEFSSDDLHAIDDGEQIRDHMLRAIYGSFANARQRPENANLELAWVGYLSGKRESRRLLGDHIYTMDDAVSQRYFPDTVVTETRAIDVHFQRILQSDTREGPDFLSRAIFRPVGRYYIPFRCLYSRNIENLMMAGRCFSCSHIGLGGPRVMNTCGQMGIATGYAASLCKQHDATPREVGREHIEELRALIGETAPETTGGNTRTSHGKFELRALPEELRALPRLTVQRGNMHAPAPGFSFTVNLPVTVFLAVHLRGDYTPPDGWEATDMEVRWGSHRDRVYRRDFAAGSVEIPAHTGTEGRYYGLPHMVFLKPREPGNLEVGSLPEDRLPRLHRADAE